MSLDIKFYVTIVILKNLNEGVRVETFGGWHTNEYESLGSAISKCKKDFPRLEIVSHKVHEITDIVRSGL